MVKALIVGLMVSLLGCQTENLTPRTETPQQPDGARKELSIEGVKFNGEYLEFDNPKIFEETLKTLGASSPKEQMDWERQFKGFVSLRNVFEQAVMANQKQFEEVKKQIKDKKIDKNTLKNFLKHSDFVNKNANAFLFSTDENDFTLQPNLHDMRAFSVVNKDGMVKVGRYLFQYTKEHFKVLPATKKDKIETLKRSRKDDPANEIVVKATSLKAGHQGGRTEAYNFAQGAACDWVPVYIGWGNIYTRDLRRVSGGVNITTNVYPVYSCDNITDPKEYHACTTNAQNPPYIVGYSYYQYYSTTVSEQEKTEYYAFDVQYATSYGNSASQYLVIEGTHSAPLGNFYHQQYLAYSLSYSWQSPNPAYMYNLTGTVRLTGGSFINETVYFSY